MTDPSRMPMEPGLVEATSRVSAAREALELPRELVEAVLDATLASGADFAELFVEDKATASISLIDGKVKDCASGRDYGAGVRALYGTEAVYAYTSDLSLEGLLAVAREVAAVRSGEGRTERAPWAPKQVKPRHTLTTYMDEVPKLEKVAVLRRADAAARAFAPQIVQVEATMAEEWQRVFIANSEGTWISDERPYVRLMITAIAEEGKEKQSGRESPGALGGWEAIQAMDVEGLARHAAEVAMTMLRAGYAPSGKMPVVIDNAFGGVIFHEACGHLLETTSVAKGASIMAGRLGEQVANPKVTAVDDGTMDGEWGSIAIDDEGEPAQRTVLIEGGVLKSYMVDKLGARKTGYAITGSGRRQGYRYAPTSRMRNTFIAAGEDKFDDMIASIDYGLYAKKMGGGSVSPGTGDFNFAVMEAYMIRGGKIAEAVRGATLVGNGAEVLMKIDMVGDNFAMAAGRCGSVSGSIATNVGQPALRVSEIVVGGRA